MIWTPVCLARRTKITSPKGFWTNVLAQHIDGRKHQVNISECAAHWSVRANINQAAQISNAKQISTMEMEIPTVRPSSNSSINEQTTNPSNSGPASQSQNELFLCFPSFPCEIRLEIWKAVCYEVRHIDLWAKQRPELRWERPWDASSELEHIDTSDDPLEYHSHSVPSILQRSKEVRKIGFENYDLGFGTDYQKRIARFYVNLHSDILCFMPNHDQFADREYLQSLDKCHKTPGKIALETRRYSLAVALRAKFPSTELILYYMPEPYRIYYTTYRQVLRQIRLVPWKVSPGKEREYTEKNPLVHIGRFETECRRWESE